MSGRKTTKMSEASKEREFIPDLITMFSEYDKMVEEVNLSIEALEREYNKYDNALNENKNKDDCDEGRPSSEKKRLEPGPPILRVEVKSENHLIELRELHGRLCILLEKTSEINSRVLGRTSEKIRPTIG